MPSLPPSLPPSLHLISLLPYQVIQLTNEATFSSSAVDTKGFLLQVGAFWKHLEWPTAPESFTFAAAIVQVYIVQWSMF